MVNYMKTFLKVWFSSDGGDPSDITSRLVGMGFKPTTGGYDYVYIWKRMPTIDDLVEFAEQVQQTLKGTGIYFKLETQ